MKRKRKPAPRKVTDLSDLSPPVTSWVQVPKPKPTKAPVLWGKLHVKQEARR